MDHDNNAETQNVNEEFVGVTLKVILDQMKNK